MNRMKSSYSSGLIQSSFFLVIKDDEQYSVASIATLRRKKIPVAEGDERHAHKVRRLQRRNGWCSGS